MKRTLWRVLFLVMPLVFTTPVPVWADASVRSLRVLRHSLGAGYSSEMPLPVPDGVAVCLVHGNPSLVDDETVPFPARFATPAVVACDTVLKTGGGQLFEYDSANTPGFDELVAGLTNGIDETVFTMVPFVTSGSFQVDVEWEFFGHRN